MAQIRFCSNNPRCICTLVRKLRLGRSRRSDQRWMDGSIQRLMPLSGQLVQLACEEFCVNFEIK